MDSECRFNVDLCLQSDRLTLLETWTACKVVQVLYELVGPHVVTTDLGRICGCTPQLTQNYAFGGSVDFLAISRGEEKSFPYGKNSSKIVSRQVCDLGPRFSAIFLQEFLANADCSCACKNSERLRGKDDGVHFSHDRPVICVSLPALVYVGHTINYRLS